MWTGSAFGGGPSHPGHPAGSRRGRPTPAYTDDVAIRTGRLQSPSPGSVRRGGVPVAGGDPAKPTRRGLHRWGERVRRTATTGPVAADGHPPSAGPRPGVHGRRASGAVRHAWIPQGNPAARGERDPLWAPLHPRSSSTTPREQGATQPWPGGGTKPGTCGTRRDWTAGRLRGARPARVGRGDCAGASPRGRGASRLHGACDRDSGARAAVDRQRQVRCPKPATLGLVRPAWQSTLGRATARRIPCPTCCRR